MLALDNEDSLSVGKLVTFNTAKP